MSGRSAYVRKKINAKDGGDKDKHERDDGRRHPDPLLESFPMPAGRRDDYSYEAGRKETRSIRSTSSDEQRGYGRVRKPALPLDVSGIEKSSFRELLDKKSEGIRKGLAGIGKKKKKLEEPRPQTSTTIRPPNNEGESVETTAFATASESRKRG
jgi:hypothetical protein